MTHINWSLSKCECHLQHLFFYCVTNLGFQQLVTAPTRMNNILDLVLVDNDRLVFDVVVVECFGGSDHNSVNFCIAATQPAGLLHCA